LALEGHGIVAAIVFMFYYLGGVGVREHSRYAAAVVLTFYGLETLSSLGVVRVLFAAVLLANLRATWIASRWKPGSEEAAMLPPRMGELWTDKFTDKLPAWLWPKVRIPYYLCSACLLLLFVIGFVWGLVVLNAPE
jgi:hypothetical protein